MTKKSKGETKHAATKKKYLYNGEPKLIKKNTTKEEANAIYLANPLLGNWEFKKTAYFQLVGKLDWEPDWDVCCDEEGSNSLTDNCITVKQNMLV